MMLRTRCAAPRSHGLRLLLLLLAAAACVLCQRDGALAALSAGARRASARTPIVLLLPARRGELSATHALPASARVLRPPPGRYRLRRRRRTWSGGCSYAGSCRSGQFQWLWHNRGSRRRAATARRRRSSGRSCRYRAANPPASDTPNPFLRAEKRRGAAAMRALCGWRVASAAGAHPALPCPASDTPSPPNLGPKLP